MTMISAGDGYTVFREGKKVFGRFHYRPNKNRVPACDTCVVSGVPCCDCAGELNSNRTYWQGGSPDIA